MNDTSRLDVGVIGAGTMGGGIAQVAAMAGHQTFVYDTDADAGKRAGAALDRILARLVEKGKLDAEEARCVRERVTYTDRVGDLADCRLVIEAIFEDLDIKRETFRRLEDVVAAESILATNTSSLSIAAIAAVCAEPSRVLGVHFFNPAPLMPLVEIVPGLATDPAALARTRRQVDDWGKTTVVARDTPGFIVNRVARPFYGEALRIFEEGVADVPTIDWAMRRMGGFRMGPFELMDLIGNDVNLQVTRTVFESFFHDPRYKPSIVQQRLVEAGRLGRKTRGGFYEYDGEGRRIEQAPEEDESLGRDVFMRILAMLINEAADALFWKVATRDDIDLAMTRGVNYPKGLLRWADEIGVGEVLTRMSDLRETYCEDRYRPSPLLRRMSENGATFY